MSFWRQLTRGLHAMTHRQTRDQDVADEVGNYAEELTAAYIDRGYSPEAARRAAHLELGDGTSLAEEVRSYGWETRIETLIADVRFAGRRLRATPGFTVVAVLTMALGIGATTSIFSAVKPILLDSLPYPQPGRLVAVLELRRDGAPSAGTFAMYHEFLERSRSFDAIAVFKPWQPTLTRVADPERFEGQRVSVGYFRALGVTPVMGRDFLPSDDRVDGPNVVILSDSLWRRNFSADPTILGQSIMLDDESYEVIGVMPQRFDNVLAPAATLWAPLQYDVTQGRAWGHHLQTIGRLRPNVAVAQVTDDVSAIGRAVLTEKNPETYDPLTRFTVASLQSELTRTVRPALAAVTGGVLLVLLIACVNVTNLLLARGVHRRDEFALRTALGAGRGRLIRLVLTESLVLAAVGGLLGVAVAALGVRALVAISPPELPRVSAITVDGAVILFALGLTGLVAIAAGLVPALQAGPGSASGLQLASRRLTGGHQRARTVLVISEVALAFMLLIGSGLLLRSVDRLFAVPIGFDPSHLLTMQVHETGRRFTDPTARFEFFTRALDTVQHVPGVSAAAFTSQLPLSGDLDQYGATFVATASEPALTEGAFRYAVSPGYLQTMRIRLLSGRLLDEHDRAGSPLVALLSESLARLRSPSGSVLDERLTLGGGPDSKPYTVVGVVEDVKQASLALTDAAAVYIPSTQWRTPDSVMSFVVRAQSEPAALAPAVRQAIWSVDRNQPIVRVSTMDDLLTLSAAERRFSLMLFEAFGLTALVLATAGLYGLLAGSVAERTREIGVRAALGASRQSIVALVVRQALMLTGIGVAIGLVGALTTTRALVSMLFEISRLDPITYAGVVALIGGVALVACALPAWRAARVDPATTLRTE